MMTESVSDRVRVPQAAAMMAGNVVSQATGSRLAGGVAQGVVGALLN